MTTYFIPTTTTRNLATAYRLVSHKKDMRTTFCKKNNQHIIDDVAALLILAKKHGMKNDGDRFIAPPTAKLLMLSKKNWKI